MKKKKDEDKKINMPNNEEDLSKLIDDLSKNKITRIRINGFTHKIINNEFLNILLYLGINLLLFTASYCIFRPVTAETHWFLFTYILIFSFLDYSAKVLIFKFLQKYILLTASLIFLVEDIICIVVASLPIIFLFEITLKSTWLLIATIVVFLLVRFILTFLLRRKRV